MAGFMYRLATAMKECGERRGMSGLIRLGLAMRERVINFPVLFFE
jgi:hypothetical protein